MTLSACVAKLNNRQVSTASKIRDTKINAPKILAVSWSVALEELEICKTALATTEGIQVELFGREAPQGLMRTMPVVPASVENELMAHLGDPQRGQESARAFGLQRAKEAFDDCDAAGATNGSKTESDFTTTAPCLECLGRLRIRATLP